MRHNLLLLFLFNAFLCSSAFAQKVIRKGMPPISKTVINSPQPLFDVNMLNGKWQEVRRINSAGEAVAFTDSLTFNIKSGRGAVKVANDMSMGMIGEVIMDRTNILMVAGESFTLLKAESNMLTLRQDGIIKILHGVDKFYSETVGKDSIKEPVYTVAISPDIQMLKGKWLIYRRNAPAGFITDSTTLIKAINFVYAGADAGEGEMIVYNSANISEAVPFTFLIADGLLKTTSAKGALAFSVYKADGEELVFGKEGEVMNFGKK